MLSTASRCLRRATPPLHHILRSPGSHAHRAASMSASTPDAKQYQDALNQLYTSKEHAKQDEVVDKHYTKDAEFHDNITQVFGADAIKTQFHSLPKIFKWAKFTTQESDVKTQEGKTVVSIKNQQDYMWNDKEINLTTYTSLYLDNEGKISRHVDKWEGTSDNPVLAMMRRAMGMVSTGGMKAAGLGPEAGKG